MLSFAITLKKKARFQVLISGLSEQREGGKEAKGKKLPKRLKIRRQNEPRFQEKSVSSN
jgi:hypothetical protein